MQNKCLALRPTLVKTITLRGRVLTVRNELVFRVILDPILQTPLWERKSMSHMFLKNAHRKRPYQTHVVEDDTEKVTMDRDVHKRPRLTRRDTPRLPDNVDSSLDEPTTSSRGQVSPKAGSPCFSPTHPSTQNSTGNGIPPCQCNNSDGSCTICRPKLPADGRTSLSQVWGRYAMSNAKLRECHFLRINRSRQTKQTHPKASPPK